MRGLIAVAVGVVLVACGGGPVSDADTNASALPGAPVSPSAEPGAARTDGTQGAGATPAGDIGPLEALVIDGLPPSDAGVRDDGDGYVAVPEAVGDLALFTGAVEGTESDMMADLFVQAGFVEEYYRRWLISESDRPSMLGIQLFRFRDPEAAAGVVDRVAELLDTRSAAQRGDAWQQLLTGGPADILLTTRQLDGLPDAVVLELQVQDAEQAAARGLTYELVAFNRGPVLVAITLVLPPELATAAGRARAGEIATLQADRMVDQMRPADR